MALFERFHLSQEEAEARLKRALTGDPTRKEIGLLAALNANKYDDIQGRLARDTTLSADLRDLVAEHLQKARARWETRKAWSVTLPLPVWDEYAASRGLRAARSRNAWLLRSGATTSSGREPSNRWRRSTRTSERFTLRQPSFFRRRGRCWTGWVRSTRSA